MYETENELLEVLFDFTFDSPFRPDNLAMSFYGDRPDMPRAEMYLERDGVCYAVTVTKHEHTGSDGDR